MSLVFYCLRINRRRNVKQDTKRHLARGYQNRFTAEGVTMPNEIIEIRRYINDNNL